MSGKGPPVRPGNLGRHCQELFAKWKSKSFIVDNILSFWPVINGSSDRGENHQHNRMINRNRLLHLSSSGIAFLRVTGSLVLSLFSSFSRSSRSIPAAFVEVVPQSRLLYLALAFCYSHFRASFRCHRRNGTGASRNIRRPIRDIFFREHLWLNIL